MTERNITKHVDAIQQELRYCHPLNLNDATVAKLRELLGTLRTFEGALGAKITFPNTEGKGPSYYHT
jgi:hypothetical protein